MFCVFEHLPSDLSIFHRSPKSRLSAYESPVPKVYNALPPPIKDLDNVLAIMFMGPSTPMSKEYSRVSPLLVRRKHVVNALEWLILNHPDYEDVSINHNNLKEYPEHEPPVNVIYKKSDTNKIVEAKSIFDMHSEEGTDLGDCPFIIHGLTGEEYDTKLSNALKAIAMKHWNRGGKALGIGRSPELQSMYDNPTLYPQMFPWLFPYGLGGIGAARLSEKEHKKYLLMYHDK